MTTEPLTEAMPDARSTVLAEFARTCKAAARAVSLYPTTHPAIQSSLARLMTAAGRLTGERDVEFDVFPGVIAIDGQAPVRPDPAIGELAALLHQRLIGTLSVTSAAGADDWLALLLLLSRPPEDLIAEGGIGKAWTATGRGSFEIREIDYREVLREWAGGEVAEWDRIIAACLAHGADGLDDRAIALMVDTFGDATRLAEFIDSLTTSAAAAGVSVGARAAALLRLLQRTLVAAGRGGAQEVERILDTVAQVAPTLTPDMMMALLGEATSAGPPHEQALATIVTRMGDAGIATFVANAVVAEHGATERLAQAFQTLVPDSERQGRLLELAKDDVERTPLGAESGFEDLWQSAAGMITSYSDKNYVSADYGRELSGARTHALEVERLSDDPPERIHTWLSSVSDTAVRHLDLTLILDLLRIETDPVRRQGIAAVAAAEIERRTRLGEFGDALDLTAAIAADASVLDALSTGPLVGHIVAFLRTAGRGDVEPLTRLCHAIGPRIAKPLAEALAIEESNRAVRQLRELLLSFGAAGRQSVERLKGSPNSAVRRMAVDLLRHFGGIEALPDLASMLDDADPQVQRESIRAIVNIGTREAYAVLEHVLVAGRKSRDTVLQELIGLREPKALPLLCYVLMHTAPRGPMVEAHTQIMDALGSLSAHPESTRTLKQVLYRGEWWAPARTARLRRAAATALHRIGSPDASAVLAEAATRGGRGVRNAARQTVGMSAQGKRDQA
jgi:HEAT repeat protein